jgi:hypothetical protein
MAENHHRYNTFSSSSSSRWTVKLICGKKASQSDVLGGVSQVNKEKK